MNPALRDRKPKAGLFTIAGDWLWQVAGERPDSRYAGMTEEAERDARQAQSALSATMDVVPSGTVRSAEAAERAARLFESECVDFVIVCNIRWSEDQQIFRLLKSLPSVPLLLWCYQPEAGLPDKMTMVDLFRLSGSVGALQMSAVIKNAGRNFGFSFGPPSSKACLEEITAYAQAARAAHDLKGALIGLLPARYDGMMGTYTDEFRLASELGPVVRYISIAEYKKRVDAVPEPKARDFAGEIRRRFRVLPELTEDDLSRSARLSLGLARLVEELDLHAIAIQDLDVELHSLLGGRPCLTSPEIYKRGSVVTMEGEVALAAAMLIQRKLTGKSPMYVEIFSFDTQRSMVIAGHAGMHDVDGLSRGDAHVVITPDFEYDQVNPFKGAWQVFTARPGPVTLLSLVDAKDCFQMTVARGEATASEQILFGSPHMNLKLNTELADFFRQASQAGVTQHWAIGYGDTTRELRNLANILGMRFTAVE